MEKTTRRVESKMNTAYKQFLKDALTDYCTTNGIDVDDIIEQVEFRAANPISVTDENGHQHWIIEPDAFTYAEASDTYIVSALDRDSLRSEYIDVNAIDENDPSAVSAILANWCDECCADFNEASCDLIDWRENLQTAFESSDVDFDSYQID